MYKLKMPKFGLTMESGYVGYWFKKEGEFVKKGEPLVEIESEKIVNVVDAPCDGIIRKVLVKEGEESPVGSAIAIIVDPGEEYIETTEDLPSEKEELQKPGVEQEKIEKTEVLATPAAKRLAKEKGVDLRHVQESTGEKMITEGDVLDFIEKQSARDDFTEENLSPMRKEISSKLAKSYSSAVLVTNFCKADFSYVMTLKDEKHGISVTAILIKVLGNVLREFPNFNAWFDGNVIRRFKSVNIGIAVDTATGLVVPVIKKADLLTLEQINTQLEELSNRARGGSLSIEDVSDSHFTLTNLGMTRTDFFTPVLNGQEVAILGVGRTVIEPRIKEGSNELEIKHMGHLSLSYDHRVIDGAEAAKFLGFLCRVIEQKFSF